AWRGIVAFTQLGREGRMRVTIGRRELLVALGGGAAAAWPLMARAQQPERMRRIGVLVPAAAGDPVFQARVGAFLQGLARLPSWLEAAAQHADEEEGNCDAGVTCGNRITA